ncbi:hypothetical protein GCM10011410_01650 [Hoyosella rhizosphaerae]|uniref:Uncharacterized protein n=1 Tax=Hoyosella rhizosphaerae TaxID=1755582 RepID=A0A916TZ70_9ACTN|nr:hypothetical protein GCM10011410_01650 [Hoyosella rhizosphaerae]
MRIARTRADAGCAVVVVMHDLGLAAAYGDRAVILCEGRVHSNGPTRDVITSGALSEVYGLPVTVIDLPGTTHPVVVPAR